MQLLRFFVRYVWKNWPIDQEKFYWRKTRKPRKRSKILLVCFVLFSPVKFWSKLFFEVSISFSTKSRPLSNSRPPSNFQKSNPDLSGKLSELILIAWGGGDVPGWNWLRHKCANTKYNCANSGHTAIFLLHKLSKTSKWLTNLAHNLIFQYDRNICSSKFLPHKHFNIFCLWEKVALSLMLSFTA